MIGKAWRGEDSRRLGFPAPAHLIVILLAFPLASDYLIRTQPVANRQVWAVYDGFVHGVIAVLVLWPLHKGKPQRVIAAFLAAILVDLDHFVVAGSLSIEAALHSPVRLFTHSLTFALAAGRIAACATRSPRWAWLVSIALASHVLRDATFGLTPVLWPLPLDAIPVCVYYTAEVVLLLATTVAADHLSA